MTLMNEWIYFLMITMLVYIVGDSSFPSPTPHRTVVEFTLFKHTLISSTLQEKDAIKSKAPSEFYKK